MYHYEQKNKAYFLSGLCDESCTCMSQLNTYAYQFLSLKK
jgi:hypothetical protein